MHSPARKYNFALVTHDGTVSCWGTWDTATFKALSERSKEDTLYVKKGEDMYAITDRGIVGDAKKALEPMMVLGKRQGELGKEQGKLGAQQGKLGAKQGEYGRQMGEIAREMASDREGNSRAKGHDHMRDLSKLMGDLGKEQSALGQKQSALGARQSELGKQQAQAAKEADEKVTKLIDDAFARGLAKKV